MAKQHQQHARLARPAAGEWGRNELALLGAPCAVLRALAARIARQLSPAYKIGWADAAHEATAPGAFSCSYMDRQGVQELTGNRTGRYLRRFLFNDADLVLVNGNHFTASQQILFIDPQKPLEEKPDQLTDVQLVLLPGGGTIPAPIQVAAGDAPVLPPDDDTALTAFFEQYLQRRTPPVNGLILAGGRSERMGTDKGLLRYHGLPQRDHLRRLLLPLCREVLISCNAAQSSGIDVPKIEDRLLGLGPLGGLLSAFQYAPDAAWLTVACDLPYLTGDTLRYLLARRNPSRIATAFLDSDGRFPEPLLTIWEPRAYPVLLQALALGHSCPRKALIQADIELLQAPDSAELRNINDPEARAEAISAIKPLP